MGVAEHLVVDQDLVARGREKFRRKLLDSLQPGMIGFINGDDTRLKEEDKAKNNDYVAYRVATIMNVVTLINLTNVDGVIDQEGRVVRAIDSNSSLNNVQFNGKSDAGNGGIEIKVNYMRKAARKRVAYICHGGDENILLKIFRGEEVGTRIKL